jgi:DNA-binding response OmpR family regulator
MNAPGPPLQLLLVEDDHRLAHAVRSWMGHGGVQVEWLTEGQAVLGKLRATDYDWLVLDLGLPDTPGEQVLDDLRREGFDLPVVVMTAREQVSDRVRLLDGGADDFLVKPVHLDELAARLRVLQRRHGGRSSSSDAVLRHGRLSLVSSSRTATVDGDYVPLTKCEFWLLEKLMRNKGQVVPREDLGESLRAWTEEVGGNSVDVHVHHVRRKLGTSLIRTVRGRGYTLGAEV